MSLVQNAVKMKLKQDHHPFAPNEVRTGEMAEEDAIELLGNWTLSTIYSLPEVSGMEITAENVSQYLGLSYDESVSAINRLIYLGALKSSDQENVYETEVLYFNESVIAAADLLGVFLKLTEQTKHKLTSRDTFGYVFKGMNKTVILKYMPQIYALIEKIASESQGMENNEVYSFQYSFTKVSRIAKVK